MPKFSWLGTTLYTLLVRCSTGWWSGPFAIRLSQTTASIPKEASILSSTTTDVTVAQDGPTLSVSRSSSDASQERRNWEVVMQAILEVRRAQRMVCDFAVEDFPYPNVGTAPGNDLQLQRERLKSVKTRISDELPEAKSAWDRFDTYSSCRKERVRGAIATILEAQWVTVLSDIHAEPVRSQLSWTFYMRCSSSHWWRRPLELWNKYG